MPLSQKHVDKLKMIWFKETGELVSTEEAWEMATRLLSFCTALLEADTVDNSPSTNLVESEKMILIKPKYRVGF